jgi:hypothetical protein
MDSGFNMIVKVMQVLMTHEKTPQIAEGRICDNTVVIILKVIGNKNVKHKKEKLEFNSLVFSYFHFSFSLTIKIYPAKTYNFLTKNKLR